MNSNDIKKSLQNTPYKIKQKIFKSYNSYIFLIEKDNTEYIMKVSSNNKKFRDVYINEIENQYTCRKHPNIVQLYEGIYNDNYLYIIMEYCSGFSLDIIEDKLDWKDIKHYYQQVTKALIYIHSKNIIHRDIKPLNILLSDNTNKIIKIIDFGLSCSSDDIKELKKFKAS